MPSASAVAGYNVYRATKSGGPYKKLTRLPVPAAHYEDKDVKPRQTYYYVVTSVSLRNVESPRSPEIRATVPSS